MARTIRRSGRAETFARLARCANRLLETSVVRSRISSAPAGDEASSSSPSTAIVLGVLKELDAASPLERDPDAGVLEVFVVDVLPDAGRCYLSVENALGAREIVTVLRLQMEDAGQLESWSKCRETPTNGDTTWDTARAQRRVAIDSNGYASAIDRGANRICDLLEEAGCTTRYSCEGHPNGAYVAFEGDLDEAVLDAFVTCGWEVSIAPAPPTGTAVYMPRVGDVGARDDAWRKICAKLELALEPGASPAPSPGR